MIEVGGYAIATATQAAVALLTVPLLTRMFTPDEFGFWGLIEPLIALVAQVGLLGINHGVLKIIAEDNVSPIFIIRHFLKNLFASSFIVSLIATSLIYVLYGHRLLPAFILLCVLESFILLILSILRAQNKSFAFASVLVIKSILFLCVIVAGKYLSYPFAKVGDLVVALASINIIVFLVGVCIVNKLKQPKTSVNTFEVEQPDKQLVYHEYKKAIAYGLPLMGAGVMATIISVGDRFVMSAWVELSLIGGYVVMYKIASSLNFIVMPLNMWVPAARFKHIKDADGGQVFFRNLTLNAGLVLVGFAGLLITVSKELMDFFSPNNNAYSLLIIAALSFSCVVNGMCSTMNIGLLNQGQTHKNFVATCLAGGLQIISLIVFIPKFGIQAAAIITLIASLFNLGIQNYLSQKLYYINYPYMYLIGISGFVLMFSYFCGTFFNSLILKICLYLFVYLILIYSVLKLTNGILINKSLKS